MSWTFADLNKAFIKMEQAKLQKIEEACAFGRTCLYKTSRNNKKEEARESSLAHFPDLARRGDFVSSFLHT